MDHQFVEALVKAIELKDLSTAAHTWRVVLYTRAMAEAAGLEPQRVKSLTHAAALHDLGKIDIPDEILQKPGPLTPQERAVMETHTTLGHERLLRMDERDPDLLALVRSHHERLDGTGYPDRLKETEIPIPARYFAVIDSFDAMTSLRPYRTRAGVKAAPAAIEELRQHTGTHYAPEAVELFTMLYASKQLDWILEYFNDTTCPVTYEGHGQLDEIVRQVKK